MPSASISGTIDDVHNATHLITGPEPAADRLRRRSGGRIVGGVAGGIADHLGVDVFKVRIAFVLLAALGAGILAYGMLWVFTPSGTDTERPSRDERRRAYGLAVMGLGLAAALSWVVSGTVGQIIGPIIIVAVGAALVWREFDSDGPRSVIGLPQRPSVLTWSRIVGGATLIVVGLAVVILARVDLNSLGPALLAVFVTLIGAGLLTVPLWLRTLRALNEERAARIRNDEREEIASHLHDSVLQTLALIQKQSESPTEVLRLARGQERELRKWLFSGDQAGPSSLAAALRTIAGEVEDQHGVKVTPVTVGDAAMGDDDGDLPKEHFTAVLGASREAMVNAAKHSGVAEIDLFAEAEADQVSVFVRDRGKGFDQSTVSPDRQGLSRSIRGRIERRGGEVDVRSTVGKGTEIRIRMPRSGAAVNAQTGDAVPNTDAPDLEWGPIVDATRRSHIPEEQPR